MDLNIDQLAELKIAIKKAELILKEREATNNTLETRNKNLTDTNKRLDNEIELQVARIDEAKAENQALIEEKQGILSKFAEDNEKVYKELREKEQKINQTDQQNSLRLLELDKREWRLANKDVSNKATLAEARQVKAEIQEDLIRLEQEKKNMEKDRENKMKLLAEIDKRKEKLWDEQDEVRKKKEELSNKESDLLEEIQANQNLLLEIKATKEQTVADKERLEKLIPLFKEIKDFVLANVEWLTPEQLEAFINRDENAPELIKSTEEIKEEVSKDLLGKMSYNEMLAEAKSRGLKFEKAPKKVELKKILSNL